MNKNILLIADKSLYDTWIRVGLDISDIEKRIEKEIGLVIATDKIASRMQERIPSIRSLSSKLIILWKKKIALDNSRYLELIEEYSPDIGATYLIIENDAKKLLELLHTFDRGASSDDVDLLANARWIGMNTPFEPFIATEDRDLLGFGQMISSYLGLPLGFLSIFEILVLADLQTAVSGYFKYSNLPMTTTIRLGDQFSAPILERDVSNLVRKTKICFHPTLRTHDSIRRITRQMHIRA